MEVESIPIAQTPPKKASFSEMVRGDPRCFPTIVSLLEQMREDIEEAILEPETQLKVSFSQKQL